MKVRAIFIRIGRYRLIFGYLIAVACLIFVRQDLFVPGVLLALVGIAVRLWSAGCIEKNTRLAVNGPYALSRNPLYLGSFLLGIGTVVSVRAWWLVGVYCIGFIFFYWPTIKKEEEMLSAKFGEEYRSYQTRVPVFFPKSLKANCRGFSLSNIKRNREHRYALLQIAFLVILEVVGRLNAHHLP